MIGLFEALKAYDTSRGASFETYARIRIQGAMIDEVRRQFREIPGLLKGEVMPEGFDSDRNDGQDEPLGGDRGRPGGGR